MNQELTKRQKDILNYIRRQVETNGYPPSVREIGQAVGLSSSSTVHAHLKSLESLGLISKKSLKMRAIQLTENRFAKNRADEIVEYPLLGRIAAGQPILAAENIDDYIKVPASLLNYRTPDDCFFLQVKGESMINAGILPGDMILVRKQDTAENGDIVVALLEDNATVKRFYKDKDYIRLQPENPGYAPIITRHVSILGKVVSLIRNY